MKLGAKLLRGIDAVLPMFRLKPIHFAKRQVCGFRLKAGMTGSGRLIRLATFGASRSLIETEVTVRKGILCTSPG